MKAIETVYNGYKFRSRLEARWAVFFNSMGINYQYELEWYDLGTAGYYLPDFWLPDYKIFVEVKPLYKISEQEKLKATELSKQSDFPVLMLLNCSEKQTHLFFNKETTWPICLMACKKCNSLGFLNINSGSCFYPKNLCEPICNKDFLKPLIKLNYFNSEQHQRLLSATLSAQQARFEHGETPLVRH